MEKSARRHPTEIVFSPLSFFCLLLSWVGVSALAFYVGMLVGRGEQIREIRRAYRAEEVAQSEDELPLLSFEESLTAPDEAERTQEVSDEPSVPVSQPEMKTSMESPGTGVAVLQIASFRQPELAEQLVQELRQKGYRSFRRISDPSEAGGGYSRVFVGPLPSVEMARELKDQLEQREGYKDILIRPVARQEDLP
jgi:cell division septation protein DedD